MRVEEKMNIPVVITHPTTKIKHLKDQLNRKNISAVPVLEVDGTIAGIITVSDLMIRKEDSLLVKDLMTPKVHICLRNNRIKDAAKIMVKHQVHHLVVMEEGKVIGMLSSMDIVKVFSEII